MESKEKKERNHRISVGGNARTLRKGFTLAAIVVQHTAPTPTSTDHGASRGQRHSL